MRRPGENPGGQGGNAGLQPTLAKLRTQQRPEQNSAGDSSERRALSLSYDREDRG